MSRRALRAGRDLVSVARLARRRAEIARSRAATDGVRVYYGYDRLPQSGGQVSGGMVKFTRLEGLYPNAPRDFNVLYLGSSSAPPDTKRLVAVAQRRGAGFVWNQDGVAYPGLAGWDVERTNAPMRLAVHAADHVFFQSEFCRLSADRFLGPRSGPSEVLYNAVDTTVFTPSERAPDGLVLLLAGSQYQWYRIDVALRTVARLAREREDVTLIVAGALSWTPDARANDLAAKRLVVELGIEHRVEFVGPYTQADAPALLRRAHLLLHTKYNDPCPGAVVEALACGLPVVHSASGGVPELVGAAGHGVPAPLDFDRDHPPDPAELAAGVLDVASRLGELAAAARERAVAQFDIQPWVERHRRVFEGLTS